jgi:hypothetical protein
MFHYWRFFKWKMVKQWLLYLISNGSCSVWLSMFMYGKFNLTVHTLSTVAFLIFSRVSQRGYTLSKFTVRYMIQPIFYCYLATISLVTQSKHPTLYIKINAFHTFITKSTKIPWQTAASGLTGRVSVTCCTVLTRVSRDARVVFCEIYIDIHLYLENVIPWNHEKQQFSRNITDLVWLILYMRNNEKVQHPSRPLASAWA